MTGCCGATIARGARGARALGSTLALASAIGMALPQGGAAQGTDAGEPMAGEEIASEAGAPGAPPPPAAGPATPAPAGGPTPPGDAPESEATLGPVTGLALPRYVSLRASEARARRGPSLAHRVDWLYRRRGLPLRVTAEHGNWRRVEDIEGYGGWVHHSLISGTRTVIVTEDLTTLLRRPEAGAPEVAKLEAGVIARLGECRGDWCRLDAEGHGGWAPRRALWGAG